MAVGAEDRAAHFKSILYGQGASMALPIWGVYMKSCYDDKTLNVSTANFEVPANLSINVNCSKGSGNYVDGNDSDDTPEDLNF